MARLALALAAAIGGVVAVVWMKNSEKNQEETEAAANPSP